LYVVKWKELFCYGLENGVTNDAHLASIFEKGHVMFMDTSTKYDKFARNISFLNVNQITQKKSSCTRVPWTQATIENTLFHISVMLNVL